MKKKRLSLVSTILSVLLVALVAVSAAAQVATLSTPDPDAAATEAPTEAIDGEEIATTYTFRRRGVSTL